MVLVVSKMAAAMDFYLQCVYVPPNRSYVQPEGCITKGAAQRDRPNAYERHLWLPPNGHE